MSTQDSRQEHVNYNRRIGNITENGMVFDWWLVNADGAAFMLFREPHHTDSDVLTAKSQIERDNDIVGKIYVEVL